MRSQHRSRPSPDYMAVNDNSYFMGTSESNSNQNFEAMQAHSRIFNNDRRQLHSDEGTSKPLPPIPHQDTYASPYAFHRIPLDSDDDPQKIHEPTIIYQDDRRSVSPESMRHKSETTHATEEICDTPRWHPFWMRWFILVSFSVLFISLTAALIFMVVYSRLNEGLTDARDNLAYVWRFGPTAFVTILTVFWARTELQVLRYTPWLLLRHKIGTNPNDYELDYTEMLPPVVLFQSLKRKHFLVFVAAATTVFLKAQIVLSSSIFQSIIVERLHETEVQLMTSFNGSNDTPISENFNVYAHVQAIKNFDMDLPFGVSEEFAYQTFTTVDSANGTVVRAENDAPLTVAVDALSMGTECLILENYEFSVEPSDVGPVGVVSIQLHFEDCRDPLTQQVAPIYVSPSHDVPLWTVAYLNDDERPCASLPQQNPQFLYMANIFTPSPDNSSLAYLKTSAAALCSSYASMPKVDIVDDGIAPLVSLSANQTGNSTLDLDPWQLLARFVPGLDAVSMTMDDVGGPIVWQYQGLGKTVNESDKSLYDSQLLREAVTTMSKDFFPMLAHYQFREEIEEQVAGTTVVQVVRLQVNFGVCVAMATLFAVCALFALSTLWHTRNAGSHYLRDPATILGSMIYTNSGHARSEAERAEDEGRRKAAWSQGTFSPLILKLWYRSLFILLVLGLIIGLAVALCESNENKGLGTVDEGGYWPLLWQSLPSLAMLLVSLYSAAFDTTLRSLAILSHISTGPRQSTQLDTSLLDMLGFRALYYSIRYKIPAVTLSQSLAVICGFLPIISSILLIPQPVPDSVDITFQQTSWFGYHMTTNESLETYKTTRNTLSNLNNMRNMSNFTYPRNTYFDLVFPSFDTNDPRWQPGVVTKVTTPAAKLTPVCKKLSESDGDFFVPDLAEQDLMNYDPIVTQDFACPNGTRQNATGFLDLNKAASSESAFFGKTFDSPQNLRTEYVQCSGDTQLRNKTIENPAWVIQTYIWGNFSSARLDFDHLSMWRCNYSWSEVTTEMNLLWSDGDNLIDHNDPPVQDLSSIKPWSPPFSIPIFEESMLEYEFTTTLDSVFAGIAPGEEPGLVSRFRSILQPYGPITVADLGDPDQEEQVLQALHSNLGFITAQLANIEHRFDLDETSDSVPANAPLDQLRPITATITDTRRLRIVQNQTITFVLIAILSLTAIAHIWALLSELWRHSLNSNRPRSFLLNTGLRGLAPPAFSSIAMTESLMEGSNCSDILPENAHLMPAEELHEYLKGKYFRLGWFYNLRTGRDVFTVAALNDGGLIFRGDRQQFEKMRPSEGQE